MKLLNKIMLLFILSISCINAKTIDVVVQAENLSQATENALSSLSSMIESEVDTKKVLSTTDNNGIINNKFKYSIKISSNLPIIGVIYENLPSNKSKIIKVKASIDSIQSLPIYMDKINKISKSINEFCKIDISLKSLKYKKEHYKKLITMIDNLDRYKIVAMFLGKDKFQKLEMDKETINSKLLNLDTKAQNIKEVVELLAEEFDITNKSIEVEFPKYKNSMVATKFAKKIQKNITEYTTINNTKYRQYKLKGKYTILDNKNVYLTYKLYDKNDFFIKAKNIEFDSSSVEKDQLFPESYCIKFENRKKIFGLDGWKNKFIKTLQNSNINYSNSCENSNKFLIYIKHKNFYSSQSGSKIHYFMIDIKLKNKKNQIIAHEKKKYTYANQDEDVFNYELQNVEMTDKVLQNKLISMMNK